MSQNLLDSLSEIMNNDLIKSAAAAFGESEIGITKAIGAAVPSLLSGIMKTTGTDGGSNLLGLAKQAAASGILENVGSIFSGSNSSSSLLNTGTSMLSGLLGNKVGGLTSLLSGFAGVKPSTTSSILSAIAPIALGFIGKQSISNNLSGSGILSWLSGQKSQINDALPAGLNLSGIFNGGVQNVTDTVHKAVNQEAATKGTNWLLPLLFVLLALAFLWYFMKGCNREVEAPVVTDSAVVAPVAPEVIAAPVKESLKVKLPDGSELDAYKGGIEDQLVNFLNNANAVAGKEVWFDFDNLNFETGSAKITAESQAQVNNIAAILKAYSKVAIKIGGYTDVTGDAAANKKLSQDRADAVVAALKTAGSAAGQIEGGEGYGARFAKAAADAPDSEKAKDRRIAVSIRKK